MKLFAKTAKWNAASALSWDGSKHHKQGDLLYKVYYGEMVTSLFSVDQYYCVQMKIFLSVRQPDHLSRKHTQN